MFLQQQLEISGDHHLEGIKSIKRNSGIIPSNLYNKIDRTDKTVYITALAPCWACYDDFGLCFRTKRNSIRLEPSRTFKPLINCNTTYSVKSHTNTY